MINFDGDVQNQKLSMTRPCYKHNKFFFFILKMIYLIVIFFLSLILLVKKKKKCEKITKTKTTKTKAIKENQLFRETFLYLRF